MSVIVAVRVRPFNSREIELNSQLCVKMHEKTTTLIDENGAERHFTFDYSFWSHSEFETLPNGLSVPTSPKYADQQFVYGTVGKTVLQNAIDGYHCCLFAYGQTGSGKSYSMIGYGPNRGIVPMIAEEIFTVVRRESNARKSFEVTVSMIEIYNEKIQDLLIPITKRPLGGLKVRESKTHGVYVEDLSRHPVDSYDSIEERMEDGNKNRTIAATQMNSSSSRAHTIITIEFKQFEVIDGKKVERFSVINLVDLAGSEKVAKTGATGDRLKEGCSINKSLTVLGLVISALADKAMGKGQGKVVPYRDSALTRILQNALGGNSKTLMICAISPSSNNYEESLSTLRYADQAKKIKLHAVVNESETDKKIRELQRENDELKKYLMAVKSGNMSAFEGLAAPSWLGELSLPMSRGGPQVEAEEVSEYQQKIQSLERMLASNRLVMDEYQRSFEDRMQEERAHQVRKEVNDYSAVHIINLNEDQMLSGQIYHNLERTNPLLIGRKNGEPTPHIVLHAIGIQTNHARIVHREDGFYLEPADRSAGDFLYLNGENVYEPRRLRHCDRIVFGISSFFLFKNPREPEPPVGFAGEHEIDWERCQMEMSKRNSAFNGLLAPDPEAGAKNAERFQDIEREVERMKGLYEEEMRALREEHARKMEEIAHQQSFSQFGEGDREELIQMEIQKYEEFKEAFEQKYVNQMELERAKKDLIEKEVMHEFREKDKRKLESKMLKIHPNIIEANLIAQELKRNVAFSMHISYFYIDFDNINKYEKQKKYRIKVKVDNHELGYYYYWDLAKFSSRYFLIKDLLERFYETNQAVKLLKEDDPFWDPPEHQKVGEGFLKLMSLAYLMDNPNELILVGDEGKSGLLNVDLVPCDDKGRPLEPDDPIFEEFVDDPNDLLRKRVNFAVRIG